MPLRAQTLPAQSTRSALHERVRVDISDSKLARLGPALAGLFAAAAVLAPTLSALRAGGPIALEDDGFYYTEIARRLARQGLSSFDGLSLTNGYHPLWLALLAAKTAVLGDSPLGVVLLEAALLGASVAVLLRASALRTVGPAMIFTAVYAHYVGAMSGLGMEVSLFAACAAVFVAVLAQPPGEANGWRLGLAAAACIGARIDAAAFVLPAVCLCAQPRRVRMTALALVVAAGAAYATLNLAVFGVALPVSSAVKSLGGLQVNHRFFAQLALEAQGVGRGGQGRMVMTLIGCAAAPVIALAAPKGSPARTLGAATGIGGLLLFAKLAFDSSWQIWPWYSFPLVFVFATALLALGPWVQPPASARVRAIAAGLGLLALAAIGARAAKVALSPPQSLGFYAVNQAAARRFALITHGAPLAMGDRAGSFAWSYPGPVVQLEGLVNDAAWLRLLKARRAPAPELCRRGVRFVAAYTPPMGRYGVLETPLMRPRLTQYPAPPLRVYGADELAAVSDPSVFDAATYGDGDSVLRLWRLRCPAEPAAEAGPRVAPAPPAAHR